MAERLRPVGSPRQRILHATAASVRQKGYRAVTVTDIVSAARISRRSFYNEFPSKADAFIATYERGFEQAIAACAPAFFAERAWPERVWHAAQAFNRFLLREPLIAYLGFVHCYAVGPRFTRRVHDTQLAFTMFLEDGYRQRRESQSLSRACSSLTASAIFEAGFQRLRCGSSLQITQLQPLAVYIALVPLIGRDEAGTFLMAKLSAAE
jgi:AcrR family transcriptional regulator